MRILLPFVVTIVALLAVVAPHAQIANPIPVPWDRANGIDKLLEILIGFAQIVGELPVFSYIIDGQ